MSFVPRSKRNAAFDDEYEDEEEKRKEILKKRESTKIAKNLAKQKFVEEKPKIIPFQEPDAPDTNDFIANQEEEYSLWEQREIERIRSEQRIIAEEAYMEAKSRQKKEMTTEELLKLNSENAKPKHKMKFMQKYYHKGAYFVDDSERSKELAERDYTTPTGDDLLEKTIMPKEYLVRGDDYYRKGRTKYTHLANEDTTTPEYRSFQDYLNASDKPRRRIRKDVINENYNNKSQEIT